MHISRRIFHQQAFDETCLIEVDEWWQIHWYFPCPYHFLCRSMNTVPFADPTWWSRFFSPLDIGVGIGIKEVLCGPVLRDVRVEYEQWLNLYTLAHTNLTSFKLIKREVIILNYHLKVMYRLIIFSIDSFMFYLLCFMT